MKEKIAVLTDSGSDVLINEYKNLFILPLLIHIDNKTFVDGVDINLDEILKLIDTHKINTSLPSPDAIVKILDEIKASGYTHVIVNTISSGLSGTYNIVRVIANYYEGLEIGLIDTKNISKGGRIGLVASTVANVLDIKPIISCNENGVYHTVKKTRGYQKAINKTIELAYAFIEDSETYDLTLLITKLDEKIKETIAKIKDLFSKLVNFEIKKVTPALAIHTGPQAFGIALRRNR